MPAPPEGRAAAAPLAAGLIVLPTLARACAVCFGGEEQQLIKAFYWGGGVLILLVFGILGVLVRYIVRSERRKTELYRAQGLMEEADACPDRLF